jgi:hypothetical protein
LEAIMADDKISTSVRIDSIIHKWATAKAREEDRTLSQFVSHVLRLAKDGPSKPVTIQQIAPLRPVVAPAPPAKPAPTPQQIDMRRRALDVSCWQSVEDHVEYLDQAHRAGAITSEEYRNMNNSLDGSEPVI